MNLDFYMYIINILFYAYQSLAINLLIWLHPISTVPFAVDKNNFRMCYCISVSAPLLI